jgi:dTDP-4-dehydrorhamnose reductase
MRLAGEKPFLEVVGDQRGCPTNADDLAMALKDLVANDLRGICHATNTGDCTWHEFAGAIVSLMDLSTPVWPITTAQAGRPARRPPYSVLANCVLKSFGITLPHWNKTLNRFITNRETCAPASV